MTPTLENVIETKVRETKDLLKFVRQNLVGVAANLCFLRENDTRPWAEVLEDLDLSQGFASKLVLSYTHYVIEGGLEPERLAGVDVEKLYLSAKTGGNVEEQLARAQTLTRGELKLERDENHDHEHEWIEICKHCSIRHP